MRLPRPYKVHATEIDYKSGAQKIRRNLQRAKNSTEKGQQTTEIEASLSQMDMPRARDVNELNEMCNTYLEHRNILREFYFSLQRAKQKRRYELQKRRYIDRLCSAERQYAASDVKGVRPIMFVGDRGLSIGSRIKGFMRYGGHWKPKKHSLYTTVCITNEHSTSQTCIYCFNKLSHPVRAIHRNGASQLRTINGAFVCDKPSCVSVQAKKAVRRRDTVSAMAIDLLGLTTLLFGATFPQFNPQVSQFNTDKFKTNTASFFSTNEDWPAVDDSNTF